MGEGDLDGPLGWPLSFCQMGVFPESLHTASWMLLIISTARSTQHSVHVTEVVTALCCLGKMARDKSVDVCTGAFFPRIFEV